jgi:hypothetical protein
MQRLQQGFVPGTNDVEPYKQKLEIISMRVGYGKIGRSMPLSLDKCGNLGGDVEMVAVVKELAERHPEDEFYLIGRNTGERPEDVGLPKNVINPWTDWTSELLNMKRAFGLNKSNLTIEEHKGVEALFDQITLPLITQMDHIILWAGQHGTTNMPIPGIKDPDVLTKPHDWCAHYCAFLLNAVNHWRDVNPERREEIWLNSDPRNRLKMRDLKWPLQHPVLTQHTFTNNLKHERYGDTQIVNKPWSDLGVTESLYPGKQHGLWHSKVQNTYARLEINGLMPGTPFGNLISYNNTWEDRYAFGLFINETRKYVSESVARVNVMRNWILPLQPAWVHGTWSKESLEELGRDIQPAPWDQYYPRLHSVRCTATTPASGTGWATAKPWEAFAAGTVCFFLPGYDTQNNILGDAPDGLLDWLRVDSPAQLKRRVSHLNTESGKADWEWIVTAQREHFDNAVRDVRYIREIETRIYG